MSININKDNIDLSSLKSKPIEDEFIDDIDEEEPKQLQPDATVPDINEISQPDPISDQPSDPVYRRSLIKQLMMYKMSRLSKYLIMFDLSSQSLEMKSQQELEDLLRECKYTVGVRTNLAFFQSAAENGLVGLEYTATRTGLRVQGLSFYLQKNEEFQDLIAEVGLKYSNITYVEPEARLGLLVVRTALALHNMNKSQEATKEFLNSEISKTVQDKYQDL